MTSFEYGLIAAIIGVAMVAAAAVIGGSLAGTFTVVARFVVGR